MRLSVSIVSLVHHNSAQIAWCSSRNSIGYATTTALWYIYGVVATNTHAIATMATPRYTLVRRLAALVTPPSTRSVASRCMQRISIVKTQLVQPQCCSIHTVAASHAPQQASDGSSTTPDLQVTRSNPTATATATPTAESCGPVDDLDSDRCHDSVCVCVCM